MNRLIEDRLGKRARIYGGERAILVGLDLGEGASWEERESIEELLELSRTAGLKVLHTVIQRRPKPDPSYFIGAGKVEQLREMAQVAEAEVIIFNDALTPSQGRNLEERIRKKIIDRPQLIMDIFAQRAKTPEAQLQVELAQLEYLLPRLRGWGETLGQLGGGIGTRGPGETRLEMERQQIRVRIHKLKERLKKTQIERELKCKLREKRKIPEIALIGYTNTGKSTLLNKLSGAEAFVEDKLFATLDTLVRKATLPDNKEVVLIDTVGFIKKLPHQLIPAFKATLDAVRAADLLINVLDVSSENLFDHWRTIVEILHDIFKEGRRPPIINALNKVDRICTEEDKRRLEEACAKIDNTVAISALEGTNLEILWARVTTELGDRRERVLLEIPYSQAGMVDLVYRRGQVYKKQYGPCWILLEASLEKSYIAELEKKQNSIKLKHLSG